MIINEILIKNFRSYKGLNKFDFRPERDKSVILVGGENGAGKSSIFEAMKLCLYGPLTYRYQGIVSAYVTKIKGLINDEVYTTDDVECFIELNIDIVDKGESNNYKIRRTWTFEGSKLIERLKVINNDIEFNKNETNNFEEYFKSILPPSVFDFSFFDGEKLGEFFSSSGSRHDLKESVLILNNLDIFSILKKELELSARRKDRERVELQDEIIELEKYEEQKNDLLKVKLEIENSIISESEKIERLEEEIIELKNDFMKSGGLDKRKKEELLSEINKYELQRDNINIEIKDFSNNILPFIIVEEKLSDIKLQLDKEEEFILYNNVKEKINFEQLKNNKKFKDLEEDLLKNVSEEILNILLPDNIKNDFKAMHYLSKEQSLRVKSKIEEISHLNIEKIKYFEEVNNLTNKIAINREKLRQSMLDSEEKNYLDLSSKKNEMLNKSKVNLEINNKKIQNIEKNIEIVNRKINKLEEKIDLIKKADNIKDISGSIIEMTEELVKRVTTNKRKEISSSFKNIFSKIIRKDKFIDYIDIDSEFKVTLYVYKNYYKEELFHMIDNLNINEIQKKYGSKFWEELIGTNELKSKDELISFLSTLNKNESLKISTKVDIQNLSSGEKQIYLLCLYWALIKSADIKVPFVIDTPYARIDEKHRDAITIRFLPNISHQVIILSTNTEIEENLYNVIKPFVAKEYTLDYSIESRSTKIRDGYFYEVI